MTNRWSILFVLFFARLTMAFQYQSVAALSPLIVDGYSANLADIGFLIGLYLGPGVIVALPGGSLVARFGDRRVVGASLALMLVGGVLMSAGTSWTWLLTGRVLSGVGGVVVNIVMTKMLLDWFAGREIGTAMGIFISSWPLGIALALWVLPLLALNGGLDLAWIGLVVIIALSLVLFLIVYQAPPDTGTGAPLTATRVFPVAALLLAAAIWALYNTALAMVFGFGPLLLVERGVTATSASSITGVFTALVGIGVPLGGYLSDRLGRDRVILTSFVAAAVFLLVLVIVPLPLAMPAFALAGLFFALAAGPIMTLPSQVLRPEARAFGMGVFFTIYYGVMMVGPTLAGGIAERTGNAGTAFFLGSGLLVACILGLSLFTRRVQALPRTA
jgi:MFS family permease